MRIVVDTNVFVAATSSATGASREVLRCLLGRYEPLMGQALFAEYEAVLGVCAAGDLRHATGRRPTT